MLLSGLILPCWLPTFCLALVLKGFILELWRTGLADITAFAPPPQWCSDSVLVLAKIWVKIHFLHYLTKTDMAFDHQK